MHGTAMIRVLVRFSLSSTFLLGVTPFLHAASVLLSWGANTESDLAGYEVYYGTSSGQYGAAINVGKVTSYTVSGLNSGTFFFALKAYDTSGNRSGFSSEASVTITETPPAPTSGIITFDNPAPAGSPGSYLNGTFQGIDFGTNKWRWEGPRLADTTNHIYFSSATSNRRTFSFSTPPKVLKSLRVFSGIAGTLTLSDNLRQTKSQFVSTGSMQVVTTNWTQPSKTVTVEFTQGWELGLDNIEYLSP